MWGMINFVYLLDLEYIVFFGHHLVPEKHGLELLQAELASFLCCLRFCRNLRELFLEDFVENFVGEFDFFVKKLDFCKKWPISKFFVIQLPRKFF